MTLIFNPRRAIVMTYAQAKIIFRTVSIVVYSLLFMPVFRFITIMFSNFFSLLRPFTLFYYTVHGRCVFFVISTTYTLPIKFIRASFPWL